MLNNTHNYFLEYKKRKILFSRIESIFSRLLLLSTSAFILYLLIITTSNDVVQYVAILKEQKHQDFLVFYAWGRSEIGSAFLLWLFAQFFSVNLGFYLLALFSLSIKNYIFVRYLHYASLAFIGYVLVFVHILDANQIRESLAVCVVFYALFIEPKNRYTYLLLAGAGALFHYSGLIILTLYFVRTPIVGLTTILIFMGFADFLVSNFDFLAFGSIWLSKIPNQVNFTNSFFIMQSIISIVAISVWKILTPVQKRGAYFNTLGVVVYILFYKYPIVAHRVRELTQLGIFPLLFFDKQRLSYPRLIWIGCFLYYIIYNFYLIIAEVNMKYNLYNLFFNISCLMVLIKEIYLISFSLNNLDHYYAL